MENNQSFEYTYSAGVQAEVQEIRSKYLPQQQSKLERLRALDSRPAQKARAWAITLGTVGALVLGTGMSLIMTEFGAALGLLAFPVGIAAGLLGLVLVALSYPLYNRIVKKERAKIAPQILQLTEELLQ